MDRMPRLGLRGYLLFGVRNLMRNPRRTAITLAVTVFGVAALTFLGALKDGWLQEMQDNFILTQSGDLQIHARGFEQTRDLNLHLKQPTALTEQVRSLEGVTALAPRLRSSGLASISATSVGVQIVAVDPEREPGVSRLDENITAGGWLRTDYKRRELILGADLAQNLGVQLRDRIVLMAQTPRGGMVSELFCLRGILKTGAPQIDKRFALVALPVAQKWLEIGDAITDLVIRTDNHLMVDSFQGHLTGLLPSDDYEIMTWLELDPMVSQWLRFSAAYGLVIILVVVALVLAEILNTMLMALHERSRELAVMEAIGTQGMQLFRMVLLESVLLILVGAVIGYAAGVLTVFAFSETGIDLTRFANAFEFFYMNPVIRPRLTLDMGILILASTLVAAAVAGIYPAWKAARIEPARVLRRT